MALIDLFLIQLTCFNVGINFYNSCIKNSQLMGNLLYAIAVILIILWLLGFVVYSAGAIIHVLLVFAVIAILVRLIRGDKAV